MNKDLAIIKNISTTGWIPCTEEQYPDEETNGVTVIAYRDGCDKKWYYWTHDNCPYGWNILCRSEAYWKRLEKPFEISD